MTMLLTLLLATALSVAPLNNPPVDPNVSAPLPPEPDNPPQLKVTFAQALERGLAHNATVEVARWGVNRAESLLGEVRAASMPTLYLYGGYTQFDGPRGFGTTISTNEKTLTGNANLIVPLLNPNAWGKWSQAETNIEVAHWNDQDVRRSVALSIAHAYLSVITTGRIVEVSWQAVLTARQHYEYSLARYKGGVGNHLDELRADQEWANAQAQWEQSLTSRTKAREALGILIGEDQPVDIADDLPINDIFDPEESIKHLSETRADLKHYEKKAQYATEVRKDSWLDFTPMLLFVAQGMLQRPPTFSYPSPAWEIQFLLTIPLFDGGYRYGALHERQAEEKQALITLDNAFRQARSEVRATYDALRHAERALGAAQRGALKAREALNLANVAYHTGTTSNLEVIDAERTSRDADIDAIMADDTVRNARLDLLTAAGHFP